MPDEIDELNHIGDGRILATKDELLSLKKKWEIEQDRYSRADEFLWFTRKLREYMDTSTSPKYKVFESNFIKQYEQKYINQLNGDK